MAGVRSYPKAARLRRRREFLEVQGTGVRRHTPHFVLIRRTTAGATSRLGVTVSSRVGDSVTRNRVKRLLREIFRSSRTEIHPPADLVVIAKPGAATLTYAQAANELARVLSSPGAS